MGSKEYSYKLSQAADEDLQEFFGLFCTHPRTGRRRNEIKKRLRSSSYESDIVFYRTIEKQITIVRVLHASRDVPRFL